VKAKELFIYNETYPLPLDKYAEFKARRDGCAKNPMCINRLKFDAETFIADFGKKHGSKIETGEESSFTIVKDGDVQQKITQVKEEKGTAGLIVIGALLILGVYAIIQKNTAVGAITIMLAILLLSIEPKSGKKSGFII
jgi:hypothetical protein